MGPIGGWSVIARDLDVLRSGLQKMADRIENKDLEEIRPCWAEEVVAR